MILRATAPWMHGRESSACLITDCAATDLGMPVLVLAGDEVPLGPGDVMLEGWRIVSATEDERRELRKAGYRIPDAE